MSNPVARITQRPPSGDGRRKTGEPELTQDGRRHEARTAARHAVARATTPRGAAIVIASVSTAITLGAGIVMTVADHQNYPSIGSGLWWSVQTVTTVGYGDNVPMTLAGRLVAVLVMLVGIGFLTAITAAITSTFVSRSRRQQTPRMPRLRPRSSSGSSTAGSTESKSHSAVPRRSSPR